MARRDTDDDAPWLAEAEPRGRESTTVSRRSMFWTIVVLLSLAAIAVIGTVVLLAKKEGGSTAGYMEADQAPLIAAEAGPYKVRPGDPQGLAVDGEGQTIYATGEGGDPASAIDPDGTPEEPLLRPGSVPVTASGMSTGAPPDGAPTDLLPKAQSPAAVPPAGPAPPTAAAASAAAASAAATSTAAMSTAAPPPGATARPPVSPAAAPAAKPAKPREPLKIDIPRDDPKAKSGPPAAERAKAEARPADPRPADAAGRAAANGKPKPVTDAAAGTARPDPRHPDAKPKIGARAQLGAFKTPEAADAAWAAAGGATSGFAKTVEPVQTAGGTLYRLRASGGDGAALCAKLAARGAACKVIE